MVRTYKVSITKMEALMNLNECREVMKIVVDGKAHLVRLAGTTEEPYFCGKDVCDVLGYSNDQKALYNNVKSKYKMDLKSLIEVHPPGVAPH